MLSHLLALFPGAHASQYRVVQNSVRLYTPGDSFDLQKELRHTINLHPSYFGPQTDVYLRNKLHADVEGTCSGRLGYIIAVLGVSLLIQFA